MFASKINLIAGSPIPRQRVYYYKGLETIIKYSFINIHILDTEAEHKQNGMQEKKLTYISLYGLIGKNNYYNRQKDLKKE